MRCPSCNVATINGIRCHEIGCPDSWRDEIRECKECGCEFVPEYQHQTCCDVNCTDAYHGFTWEEIHDEEENIQC